MSYIIFPACSGSFLRCPTSWTCLEASKITASSTLWNLWYCILPATFLYASSIFCTAFLRDRFHLFFASIVMTLDFLLKLYLFFKQTEMHYKNITFCETQHSTFYAVLDNKQSRGIVVVAIVIIHKLLMATRKILQMTEDTIVFIWQVKCKGNSSRKAITVCTRTSWAC